MGSRINNKSSRKSANKLIESNLNKETLKNRVSIKYNIPYESIVYTDELPTTQGEAFKYNVIVLPTGDSDIAAQRKDVKGSYLLQH